MGRRDPGRGDRADPPARRLTSRPERGERQGSPGGTRRERRAGAEPAPAGLVAPLDVRDIRRVGWLRRWLRRHPVVTDALIAASYALAVTVGAAPEWDTGAFVVLTGAAALALMFRRRAPGLVLLAITILGAIALESQGSLLGLDFAASLALYAVVVYRRLRMAWIGLAGTALCFVAVAFAFGLTGSVVGPGRGVVVTTGTDPVTGLTRTVPLDVVYELSGFPVAGLTALAIGASVRSRREQLADLVDRANRVAREHAQRAELAAAAERTRIAREMHDIVAHSLSVMVTLADGAAATLDRSPASARTAVERLSETGREALSDMRRVLGVLRDEPTRLDPTPLDPTPGERDLDALVTGFREAGLAVQLSVSGPPLPDDPSLQLAVYRIVQESLTNVLRHAPGAGRVDVRVTTTPDEIRVIVDDDGGIGGRRPAAASGGRGLVGMRERAAVYGGSVDAGPRGAGWRVSARLGTGGAGGGTAGGGTAGDESLDGKAVRGGGPGDDGTDDEGVDPR